MPACPSHRLSFLLPDGVSLAALDPLTSMPIGAARLVTINRAGLATIEGASREQVLDAAARLIRASCSGRPPLSIAAMLSVLPPAPGRDWLMLPRGADRWSIIVGADVAFSPTALDPYFPR